MRMKGQSGSAVLTERIMWFLSVSACISTLHHLAHGPQQIPSVLSPPVSSQLTKKHLHLSQTPLLSPVSHPVQFLWRWAKKQTFISLKPVYFYCTLYWTLCRFDLLNVFCCCCFLWKCVHIVWFIIVKVTAVLGRNECHHSAKSNIVQRTTGFKVISEILGLKSVPAIVCLQLGSNDRLAVLIQAV